MAFKKFLALFCLSIALGGIFIPATQAEDSIWSGLVLGTNEEHPKEASSGLEKYYTKLKSIFGYNQYELMGQHTEMMNSPYEHWLIPRKDFSLCVDSKKSEKPGFFKIKLDFYAEEKLLAEIEARISGQNLLFIRGPEYGKGQIIIILLMK
jgi:hypothetical protein